MPGTTLLLAPWGDPAGWIYTCYTLPESRESLCSFTSLKPILEGLLKGKEGVYPRVLILTLDTLASLALDPKGGQAYSYRDVVSASKLYIEKYLCGIEAYIEALPGAIHSGNIKVSGDLRDYYVLALYTLARALAQLRPERVVLDLTHGVNYMPTLTYRAIRETASLVSPMSENGSVTLEVFNSDPVVAFKDVREKCGRLKDNPCAPKDCKGCMKEAQHASIHRVVREKLTLINIMSEIDEILKKLRERPNIVEPRRRLDDKARNRVDSVNVGSSDVFRRALRLLKLVRLGLVPELAVFLDQNPRLDAEIEEVLDKALEVWESLITVDVKDGVLTVDRAARLSEGFKSLVYAWLLSKSLKTLLESLKLGGPTKLSSVLELGNRLYRGSRLFVKIQEREREKIEYALHKDCKQLPSIGRVKLSEIYYSSSRSPPDCRVFQRDLIAHGGWHSDVVVLRVECREGRVSKEHIEVAITEDPVCREGDKELGVWDVVDKF